MRKESGVTLITVVIMIIIISIIATASILASRTIFDEAKEVSDIINLNTQFGEGWLLPAEIATYYRNGVKNVISLQPFGCIANHIIERGIEKKLKKMFPQLNLLSLDFDSGVSDVNVINRLLLFVDNLK